MTQDPAAASKPSPPEAGEEDLPDEPQAAASEGPRPATQGQLDRLRRLGFTLSRRLSADEAAEQLSAHDELQSYFRWVFERACGRSADEAGLSTADTDPVVAQMVQMPRLREHVQRMEQERREQTGGDDRGYLHGRLDDRRRNWAYHEVAAMIQAAWPRLIAHRAGPRFMSWVRRLFTGRR